MNIKRIILKEMNDFDWIKEDNRLWYPYVGMKFQYIREGSDEIYTITDIGDVYMSLTWYNDNNLLMEENYWKVKTYFDQLSQGLFHIVDDNINEQDDFDWIRDIKPHPFKSFTVGDKVIVTEITDYLRSSLEQCSEEEDYISDGVEYLVRDKKTLERGDCDCGVSWNEGPYDPEEKVLVIQLENTDIGGILFWVTQEMVTLMKVDDFYS